MWRVARGVDVVLPLLAANYHRACDQHHRDRHVRVSSRFRVSLRVNRMPKTTGAPMICTPAIVIPLTPARDLTNRPAIHRVCLPNRYARKLRQGHFVVMVDGKPVAVSIGKVSR